MSDPRAPECAAAIVAAFAQYNAQFRAITRRAPERFESRDWSGSQADVVARLELYATSVNRSVAELRLKLGDSAHDTALWAGIKAEYARRIEALADPEFLKTFFSSITRRLFDTVGVNPEVEFFALELDPLRGSDAARRMRSEVTCACSSNEASTRASGSAHRVSLVIASPSARVDRPRDLPARRL